MPKTCCNWVVRVVRTVRKYAEVAVCASSEEKAKKTAKRIASGSSYRWRPIYDDYDMTIVPPKATMRWSIDNSPITEEPATSKLFKKLSRKIKNHMTIHFQGPGCQIRSKKCLKSHSKTSCRTRK